MKFQGFFRHAAILAIFFAVYSHASEWNFNVGIGARNHTPLVLVGGISYSDITFRVQGLGNHNGPNDFWCGIRGSLLWTFFRDLPFNFDVGIGGGYEYAEAPNELYRAINRANGDKYIFSYNLMETSDISLEIWTHLYGWYTQISVPAYYIKKHNSPKLLWGVGYLIDF